MRAFIAFIMLMVLTLSAPAVDFSPPQIAPDRLPGGISAIEMSVINKADDDAGHVNLRTGFDRSARAVIETQHQYAGQTTKQQVIGWREHIILPEFGSTQLDAKIDTGARTSALHAVDIAVESRNREEWVSFHLPYLGEPRSARHSAKIFDKRKIRSTSGIAQLRYVIRTTLVLGNRQWQIEVSLADREKMKHDIILGRTAVRHQGLLVDPAKSYRAGTPVSGGSGKSNP